jgi:hypothetical protein
MMVYTEAKCLCGASRISWEAEPSFKVRLDSLVRFRRFIRTSLILRRFSSDAIVRMRTI